MRLYTGRADAEVAGRELAATTSYPTVVLPVALVFWKSDVAPRGAFHVFGFSNICSQLFAISALVFRCGTRE
ncbi:MAG: hypothetical protein ACRD40_06120 [Candidatus Acidiferrales bacterium]